MNFVQVAANHTANQHKSNSRTRHFRIFTFSLLRYPTYQFGEDQKQNIADMSAMKVAILGASGSVGKSTIEALLAVPHKFEVTGLTRHTSDAKLPPSVNHIKTDYSHDSLVSALQGHDAVVSTTAGGTFSEQKTAVDAAIEAGVKIFLPSEYGMDTAVREAPQVSPGLKVKIELIDYLKSKQDKISWIVLVTGNIFDWCLHIPGFGGFNIPARTAQIFDGGDIAYEATTLSRVGEGIAATLEKIELTKNQFVYINSFTTTQNQVLESLEKATGEKFEVTTGSSEELWQTGKESLEKGNARGRLDMIAAALYQKGAALKLMQYSESRGLWNEKLGLEEESLTAVVREVVQHYQK